MASLRMAAQNVLDIARDGIGWIALWKDGRSWSSMSFWPDYNEKSGNFVFEDFEQEQLQHIAKIDSHAILVNGWFHNLGSPDAMTRDSLADALRWQYDLQHYLVIDAVNCGSHVNHDSWFKARIGDMQETEA